MRYCKQNHIQTYMYICLFTQSNYTNDPRITYHNLNSLKQPLRLGNDMVKQTRRATSSENCGGKSSKLCGQKAKYDLESHTPLTFNSDRHDVCLYYTNVCSALGYPRSQCTHQMVPLWVIRRRKNNNNNTRYVMTLHKFQFNVSAYEFYCRHDQLL